MTTYESSSTSSEDAADGLLSIGDVAEATGISPDTLRMWERRYGQPVPVRTPSGHRRYGHDQVRWLRRVAEALARGVRAREAVGASEQELDALLIQRSHVAADAPHVVELVDLVREFRGEQLTERLLAEWDRRGAHNFLEECAAPALDRVGRLWANGELEVRHEHFASEVLSDVLRSLRMGCAGEEPKAPLVLFATLRNEQHGLGLQMTSLLATLAGARVCILGVNTPNDEIAHAAVELGASVVAISVSLASGGVETDRVLADLRGHLDPHVRLVVGGRGARGIRRGPRGLEFVETLGEFEQLVKGVVVGSAHNN